MNTETHNFDSPSQPQGADRRRFPRYRFVERLYIRRPNGLWYSAMTYEISEGGLSAVTPAEMVVGEKVHLSPVADNRLEAIVRRKRGALYGFEFLEISAEIREGVKKLCEGLPSFRSSMEVREVAL